MAHAGTHSLTHALLGPDAFPIDPSTERCKSHLGTSSGMTCGHLFSNYCARYHERS